MPRRPLNALLAVLGLLAVASLATGCSKSTPEQTSDSGSAAAADHEGGGGEDDVPALPWDQEKMKILTADLARSIRAVRLAFRQNPNFNMPDTSMRQPGLQLDEVLRGIEMNTASLATRVANGQDADQTRGLVRRIGMSLRDANMLGRSLIPSEQSDQHIRPAMALVNQIAPYYGRGPIYDLETMTMIGQGPNPNRRREGQ